MTVFGLAAILLLHGPQVQDAPKPQTPVRPINTIDRRDTIGIYLFESPDTTGKYTVSVDGTISGPLFGVVKVEGLTLEEATKVIYTKLTKYFKTPHLDVYMAAEAPAFVYVVSTLGKGSTVAPFSPGMSLRQVLAAAQTADDPDRIVVSLYREGKVIIQESLVDLVSSNKASTPLRDLDTVTITLQPNFRVFVLGAVDKPGELVVLEGTTVNKLLALVGGVKVDTVSNQISDALGRSKIIVRRGDKRFEFPAVASDTGDKFKLQAGDTISAELPQVVRATVQGEVNLAGDVLVPTPATVQQVIGAAKGGKDTAKLKNVLVVRHNTLYRVDARPQATEKFAIEQDDLVVVEPNEDFIYAIGELTQQGRVIMQEGKTYHASDVLTLAGGLKDQGVLRRVVLLRKDATGKMVPTQFNFDEYLSGKNPNANPELIAGDVIYVSKNRGSSLGQISQIAGALVFLNNVIK